MCESKYLMSHIIVQPRYLLSFYIIEIPISAQIDSVSQSVSEACLP